MLGLHSCPSMVGTNFHDSKLIKGDSAPGPNEIGSRAQMIFVDQVYSALVYWSGSAER